MFSGSLCLGSAQANERVAEKDSTGMKGKMGVGD